MEAMLWTTVAASTLLLLLPAQCKHLDMFHISDLHLDSTYQAGGPVDHWCHAIGDDDEYEGVKYNDLNPAGDYKCDAPAVLVESAIRYMHQIKPNPDVIVWTGDSSPHWKEGPEFDYIFSNFRNISQLLQRYFDGVPIIPALGNHDTSPPDDYPDIKRSNQSEYEGFYSKYLEEGGLNALINDTASQEQFKKCGFYSVKPIEDSNTRFIVLNTNLYYSNKILPEGDNEDPCDQVAWLRTQLQEAKEDEEIFVAAHVPPGFHERNISRPMFNVDGGDAIAGKFADIFRDPGLAKNVVAQFYGHTHTDSFRLFMDDSPNQKRVISTAFIQASVTPSLYKYHDPFGVNPSIRMYHYENGTILDYEQHFLDLQEFLDNNAIPAGDRRARNSKFKDLDEDQEGDVDKRSKRDGTDDDHSEGKMEIAEETEKAQQDQPKPQEGQQDENQEQPEQTPQDQHEQDLKQLRNRQNDAEKETNEDPPSDPMDDLLKKLTASWKFYYNATSTFSEPDLSPKSMAKVYVDISHGSEQGVMFKQLYKHNTVKHFPSAQDAVCNHMCWCNMTCSIVSFTVSEMDSCLQDLCQYGYVPVGINLAPSKSNDTAEVVTTSENPEEATTDSLPKEDADDNDDAKEEGDGDEEKDETATETDGAANHDADPIRDNTDGDGDNDTAELVVTSVPQDHSLRGAAIGFCIVVVLAIAVAGLLVFRRVQRNRYRAQEFLLTDSVFRYDGYSQVDGP